MIKLKYNSLVKGKELLKLFRWKEVKDMLKKLVAIILALACCLTLLAACGDEGTVETKPKKNPALENYEKPDLAGVKLTQYMPSNADYDPEGTWLNLAVEKHLGCDLEILELESFASQYFTMMAEHKVPDVTFGGSYNTTYTQFGDDGAYINYYNYLDMMPNVKAYLEDPENAKDVSKYTVRDGVLYCLPVRQEGNTAPYTFLYRKDIFEANDLSFPTSQEEFVATLRKLKEIYPTSYPFSMRSLTGNSLTVQSFGYLWGDSHVMTGHYGTVFTLGEDGTYHLSFVGETYKAMAKFFVELKDEGLMHPSCATMDTATWQESFSSDTSFITWDKTDRLPSINIAGQSINTSFQMVAAEPFNFGEYAKTTDEVHTSREAGYGAGTSYWYAIGDNENVSYSMAYIDWLFSEEGKIFTNWGVEGESYEIDENGERTFIPEFLEEQGGVLNAGLNQIAQTSFKMEKPYLESLTQAEKDSLALAQKFTGGHTAQHQLEYTEEEQFTYDTFATALYNYVTQQWSKYAIGQADFADWDNMLAEMQRKYHYDEVLKVHEDAYARLAEKYGL